MKSKEGMTLIRRFFCAILALAILACAAGAEEARTAYLNLDERVAETIAGADELIRLHVVASDDGEAAQALKLEVRDAVLDEAREILRGCADADEAFDRLTESLGELERAAAGRAREAGYFGAVRAETGTFDFPEREYAGVVVPAGEYRALRVVLGAGEGKNWWCVLFPTLCAAGDGESILGRWFAGLLGGGRA